MKLIYICLILILLGCIASNSLTTLPIVLIALLLAGTVQFFAKFIEKFFNKTSRRRRHVDFDSMTGAEFEDFCADILRDNGFKNVEVTKASGDHGIDILAKKRGKKYAIQCKRYSKNIGNKAIQEAYSGKAIYKADIGVVFTNQYFTAQAKSDASLLGVQLWDRDKLLELIH